MGCKCVSTPYSPFCFVHPNELAKFHAEQALKNILKLPCSTEQKLELVDAAVKHLKEQA